MLGGRGARADGRAGRSGLHRRAARALPRFRAGVRARRLALDEFDDFPPTVRTLRQFIASYHDLLHAVTDAQLPNPDVKG
jgi:hypothetical protein